VQQILLLLHVLLVVQVNQLAVLLLLPSVEEVRQQWDLMA
jgi:hypothetical protein